MGDIESTYSVPKGLSSKINVRPTFIANLRNEDTLITIGVSLPFISRQGKIFGRTLPELRDESRRSIRLLYAHMWT